jgi:hypothetical protein
VSFSSTPLTKLFVLPLDMPEHVVPPRKYLGTVSNRARNSRRLALSAVNRIHVTLQTSLQSKGWLLAAIHRTFKMPFMLADDVLATSIRELKNTVGRTRLCNLLEIATSSESHIALTAVECGESRRSAG